MHPGQPRPITQTTKEGDEDEDDCSDGGYFEDGPTYGPFPDENAASDYLHDQHANRGDQVDDSGHRPVPRHVDSPAGLAGSQSNSLRARQMCRAEMPVASGVMITRDPCLMGESFGLRVAEWSSSKITTSRRSMPFATM